MPGVVNLTINGRAVQAAPGTLLIEAARQAGIEIPAFCYWRGLTLQAACRMCLVEVEKMPKLMASCTLPVAEGMVARTETPTVAAARKSTLEFLLTNHPLDCPVCDKGGECELQDMVFRYGAAESRFDEPKLHVDEKQWSPVVFYDAPRCILCFRCVRICNEGMGVNALGIINRGAVSEIAPNRGDHLECDECGACIDICPVGALTSGTYRYQTRPWEMTHVGTICTHCGDGCKATLGIRNDRIIRANNRDQSGINGEFLCVKGRYAFDFFDHPERLQSPLIRVNGKFEEAPWSKALSLVAQKFREIRERDGKFGVIGSNHTTNEENYYLRKFAREVLGTPNIDHHRTGDVPALLHALDGKPDRLATTKDLYEAKAALVIGADLALEHPLLSFQIRANWRHHQARIYAVTPKPVREDKYAAASVRGSGLAAVESLGERLRTESNLVVLFDDSIKGADVRRLVDFTESFGIPVKYVALVDYSNSRGAVDMGLLPGAGGMALPEMLAAEDLDALWVVGANPLKSGELRSRNAFVVVQEMFLTETAARADVLLPAACAYEKNGTVTNTCGEVQRLVNAAQMMGTKSDLEIMGLIAKEMGAAAVLGPWLPAAVLAEIRKQPANGRAPLDQHPEWIASAHDNLFTSGTLGRYSKMLNSVIESHGNR